MQCNGILLDIDIVDDLPVSVTRSDLRDNLFNFRATRNCISMAETMVGFYETRHNGIRQKGEQV